MFERFSDRQDLAFSSHHSGREMAEQISHTIYGIHSEKIKDSLADFRLAKHRMEFVRAVNNISFIDDAKSTNINTTWYTLESAMKPVIWITGGINHYADYTVLETLVKEKVKAIICLGDNSDKITQHFEKKVGCIVNVNSFANHCDPLRIMKDVVSLAFGLASPGDTILLSPAAASFDYFEKGYEQKGDAFQQAVLAL